MDNKSPWSAYGRGPAKPDLVLPTHKIDLTFGAEREASRTREQLKQCLSRALHEYNEIRAGRTGYARIIAEALKPFPRPESIEETLRRLSGARPAGRSDGNDPSTTV
jgi:hypothetical protein